MPEDTPLVKLPRATMRAFTPPDRPRWQLDRSIDVPDTRVPRDLRALEEAARAVAPLPPPLPAPAPARAAAPTRIFPGLDAEGSAYDGALAVGREHVLVTENFSVAIVDKRSGEVVSSTALAKWFPNRPEAATFVFDPRAAYDQYADRWIVVALAWDRPVTTGLAGSWLLLSVSRGPDPTEAWLDSAIETFHDPATPAGWADYPCLGLDERAVYLTYNVRAEVARLLVFAKADLYDDGVATPFDFRGLQNAGGGPARSVQPCHHFGPGDMAHLVNTMDLDPGVQSTTVSLRSVTWAEGRPALSPPRAVTVAAYAGPPPEAEQLAEKALDVGRTRVRGAVSRAGSVWLAFATAFGAGAHGSGGIAARWCRLDPGPGRLAAQGELAEPGTSHVFPNLIVDAAGTLVLVASRSAPAEHPSLHYGRWPAAGLAESGALVPGRGPHRRCRAMKPCEADNARNGWGDYNGIGLDPEDGTTVWACGGVGHETDRELWAIAIATL